jgi:hypothetical protein
VLSGPIGARSCQTYVRHTALSIEGTLKQLACDVIYQSNKLWDELGTGAVLCNDSLVGRILSHGLKSCLIDTNWSLLLHLLYDLSLRQLYLFWLPQRKALLSNLYESRQRVCRGRTYKTS